tara:strand:- start:60 stop:710 length:651 start_codon:yes stop_codon:yes gene_type:complete
MYSGSLGTHVQEPPGLPSNWADRVGQNAWGIVTGSIKLEDTDAIHDSSGHSRISFTDTGDTVLRNAGGTAGINLNSSNLTTLAAGLTVTTGDVTVTAGNVDMVAGTLDVQDGGAVTQGSASGRATGVTLSKVTGKITTDDDTLAAVTIVKHTVTNTTVGANDVIIVNKVSGDADTSIWVDAVGAGSFVVALRNNHASDNDTTALVYNFVVIKGSNS